MKSDEILAIFKRRGVLWPTAEIYGGAQGLYDYGPVGAGVKRKLEEAWSRWFLGLSGDYWRIEPSVMLPEAVVRASGHLKNFSDPLVTCGACGTEMRADTILEEAGVKDSEALKVEEMANRIESMNLKCPKCGKGPLTPPKAFNLMFGVDFGPAGRERVYLNPETAQASYLAFSRMWNATRKRLPLGIAIIGKAFRNEIAPRQTLFRMREFTQAELQIFFDLESYPEEWKTLRDDHLPILSAVDREKGATEPTVLKAGDLVDSGRVPPFYAYHLVQMLRFFRDVLKYPQDRIRLFEKNDRERAFYNRIQYDIEVKLDSLGGYKECGAVHYRGDYDLTRHSEGSKMDLGVTLDGGKHLTPHVLELTFGVDRNVWALADVHMKVDGDRTYWALPHYLSPTAAGVLPLIPKHHGDMAGEISSMLLKEGLNVFADSSGSIGRRYSRLDEVGVPLAITVDGDSLAEKKFTVRDRDSKAQITVTLADLVSTVRRGSIAPTPSLTV